MQSTRPTTGPIYHDPRISPHSPAVAAVLELVPGLLINTFGIGHIYAGNTIGGLAIMFGYWFVLAINLLLCLVFIGFLTGPVCWIGMMVVSPIIASRTAAKMYSRRVSAA